MPQNVWPHDLSVIQTDKILITSDCQVGLWGGVVVCWLLGTKC